MIPHWLPLARPAPWAIGIVPAVALAIGGLTWPAAAQLAGSNATLSATITVMGEGSASGSPDVAYVTVGVQTQGPTATEATAENSRRMTAVLDALRALGVASQDLQTSGLSVTPQYSAPNRQEIIGYQATNQVVVTVNVVDQAGPLLDAALAAGANRVGGLRFGIRDTGLLRQQALAEATRQARAKADALAAGLGLRVVGVSSVAEESAVAPLPRPVAAAAPAEGPAPAPPPPVEAGELRVTARVRVAFLFE
jgi:uncharacterized protein YggE